MTVTVAVDDNDNEGGTVTADKETAEGETVTLTAAPDTVHDYQLKSLTVTAGDTEIPTTAGADGTYATELVMKSTGKTEDVRRGRKSDCIL